MKKYGRYEVKKKLGGGGMGVVFLAYGGFVPQGDAKRYVG